MSEMLQEKLPFNMNEVFERGPFPEGDVTLKCTNATYGQSKAGRDMITLELQIICAPELAALHQTQIRHYLVEDDMHKWNVPAISNAIKAFNVPHEGGFAPADFIGREGRAMLKHETGSDDRVRAVVKYFVTREN